MNEVLPYFLMLLKKNVLLASIITSNSITPQDLTQIEHRTHSDQAVDLLNFSLGENETFSTVNILILDYGANLTFHTKDPKYFEHPEQYFSSEGRSSNSTYLLNNSTENTRRKRLGQYDVFGPTIPLASVTVRNSSVYGYVISVSFYNFDLPIIHTD